MTVTIMTDLFPDMPGGQLSKAKQVPKGYGGIPGSGPEGETCKTCAHYTLVKQAKAYRKCGLMEHAWTRSYGTDILARSPACSRWEEVQDDD